MMFGRSVIDLVVSAIDDAPELMRHAKEAFEELASKDDGITKVTKIAAAFAAMAGHAANAAHVASADNSDAKADPIPVLKPEARPTDLDKPAPKLPDAPVSLPVTPPPPDSSGPSDSPPASSTVVSGGFSSGAEAGAGAVAGFPDGRLPTDSPVAGPAPVAAVPGPGGDPNAPVPVASVLSSDQSGAVPQSPLYSGPTVTIRGMQYPADAQGNAILNAADRAMLEQGYNKPL